MSLSTDPVARLRSLANLCNGHGERRWRGKLPIPPKAHPLVRKLFEIMNAELIMIEEVAYKGGLSVKTVSHWRYRSNPSVPNFEAALNAIGYELTIRKR